MYTQISSEKVRGIKAEVLQSFNASSEKVEVEMVIRTYLGRSTGRVVIKGPYPLSGHQGSTRLALSPGCMLPQAPPSLA